MDQILTFVKQWRQAVITFTATTAILSSVAMFVYKSALADVVCDTATITAIEVVEKKLKPIQVDIQNIKAKIDAIEGEFDTVNSQQVHIIDGIQFLKEILIEQDEVTYQKVKKKRELRNN